MSHQHFKLFKPFGYLSQFKEEPTKKKKKRLGELFDFPEGTMPIGRLDEDSEGLLLLTTDGKVSYAVTSSKYEKEYHVQVDGIATPEAIEALKKGVEITVNGEKYQTLPCQVYKIEETPNFPARAKKIRDDRHGPTSWLSITLREGKNRQVRKMTAAAGFPTLRLVRVRIGNHTIATMDAGEVVQLSII